MVHTALRHRASRRALKTKESFTRQKTTVWQPPPLFQAYPQAVKHAKLDSPNAAAETIIRLGHESQKASIKEARCPDEMEHGRRWKDKKPNKMSALELLVNRDWTEKIFILVTEGYLLQYAGCGSHDRLPERILPLCKDTAAYASDVLPGKPFVLQISQISAKNGTIDQDSSRDLLRKAGLKMEAKRASATLLLVLSGPEEMNTWLIAVRKEIEASGGKQYRPEVFGAEGLEESPLEVETMEKIYRVPSHRYLIKRDRSHPTHQTTDLSEHVPKDGLSENTFTEKGDLESFKESEVSAGKRKTKELVSPPHTSDTTASIDQIHLDRLRESPRQSYASTIAKTGSTSRCSSMERSPIMDRFDDATETKVAIARSNSATNQTSSQETSDYRDRGLEQPTPIPCSSQSRSNVVTPTTIRAASPATPNFSVPTFSKRFSMSSSSPASLTAGTPPAIRKDSNTPQIAEEDLDRGRNPGSISGQGSVPNVSASKRMTSSKRSSVRPPVRPKSSDSRSPPSSSDGERQFSRRYSSLNYARGISPVPLQSQSPSPHPPPTGALPPIPNGHNPKRASLIPPPTGPLPCLPTTTVDFSQHITPNAHLPCALVKSPSTSNLANPLSLVPPPPVPLEHQPRKLRRPVSMQVRPQPRPPTPPILHNTALNPETHIPRIAEAPPSAPVGSKPQRQEPPTHPPPPPPKSPARKTMLGVGSATRSTSDRSITNAATVTVISPQDGQIRQVAPHPFIPPIRLSEHKSKGSFDGPWNANYRAPKRAFVDLGFA